MIPKIITVQPLRHKGTKKGTELKTFIKRIFNYITHDEKNNKTKLYIESYKEVDGKRILTFPKGKPTDSYLIKRIIHGFYQYSGCIISELKLLNKNPQKTN